MPRSKLVGVTNASKHGGLATEKLPEITTAVWADTRHFRAGQNAAGDPLTTSRWRATVVDENGNQRDAIEISREAQYYWDGLICGKCLE